MMLRFGLRSIRHKLIAAFIVVILLTVLLGGVQSYVFYGYLQEYNALVDSTARANKLSGLLKPALDHEIRDIVFGMQTFEEGRQYELIDDMNARIDDLERHESSSSVQQRIDEIRNTMESLHLQVDTLKNQTAEGASVDQQTVSYELAVDITFLVEQSVQDLVREKLLAMEQKASQMTAAFTRTVYVLIGVAVFIVALSLLIAWLIARIIANPLSRIQRSLTRLSEGDLAIDDLTSLSRDEIGKLGDAFNAMLGSLQLIVSSVQETSRQVAASSEHIHYGVQENNQAGEEIAQAAQFIHEAVLEQDSFVEASVRHCGFLTASIEQILQKSDRINQRADESVTLANEGCIAMGEFMASFGQLKQAIAMVEEDTGLLEGRMEEMSALLRQIQSVSSETNILSLNASIEAARSSQSGASFAVIAQRIKQLAGLTDGLASTVDLRLDEVRQNMISIRAQMADSTSRLALGGHRAIAANRMFEAIRDANVHVQSEAQAANLDLQDAARRMDRMQSHIEDVKAQAGRIKQEIQGIAAMGEEQVASLQEVAAASDLLMDRITDMDRSVAKFHR
jgi:methyl-accepting chemotaxis protein